MVQNLRLRRAARKAVHRSSSMSQSLVRQCSMVGAVAWRASNAAGARSVLRIVNSQVKACEGDLYGAAVAPAAAARGKR